MVDNSDVTAVVGASGPTISVDRALQWCANGLVAVTWISAAVFGLYIIAYYIGAVISGTLAEWNESLPRLYVADSHAANIGMGVHFATGAILLLMGPVQLMSSVRGRWPTFHRWTGRVYVSAAILAGAGGVCYIALRGTVGGSPMTVGFLGYGMLLVIAAVQAVRFAMRRDIIRHRAWAIRLFALAIGSWIYRLDYTLWGIVFGKIGRTGTFDGWFDVIMAFWFYLPNLLVAEVFIRAQRPIAERSTKIVAVTTIGTAFLLTLVASGLIIAFAWGPTILWRLGLID